MAPALHYLAASSRGKWAVSILEYTAALQGAKGSGSTLLCSHSVGGSGQQDSLSTLPPSSAQLLWVVQYTAIL